MSHIKTYLNDRQATHPVEHSIMTNLTQIKSQLKKLSEKSKIKNAIFFKTGPGSYSEHDQFIGVSVPELRKIAKIFPHISLDELQELLYSKTNEVRLLALIILVAQYQTSNEKAQAERYEFYRKHLSQVNNWNLVDASAHHIIGAHLFDRKRNSLLELAKSAAMWERRISIVSTGYFIRKHDLAWTFKIARLLLNDEHDLIHKAVGWMLREAGKRDESTLIAFLDEHAVAMPRTMLRYAIEKFPEVKRKHYRHKTKT
jgi:3-methyladenine DNA glycosylase AlkD